MPTDPILQRIAAADWTDVPEPTVCSQLIMPVLMLLGYGQHTLHKVAEQKSTSSWTRLIRRAAGGCDWTISRGSMKRASG